MTRVVALAAAVALVGVSCGESGSRHGGVEVTGAVVSEGDTIAAGYAVVSSTDGDTLVGARSPSAGHVSLHATDGEMMLPVDSLEVPADGELFLEPGGDHLMLEDLPEPLAPGDEVELVLEFETIGEVQVEAEVVAYVDVLDAVDGDS